MATNSFKEAIREYLEQRAKQDTLFAVTYAKPNKSVDECCNYIMKEARKRGNAVCMKDEEVYGLAVHYYDEDSIKDANPVSATAVAVSTPSSAKQSQPVMNVVRNKKADDSRQMSLF